MKLFEVPSYSKIRLNGSPLLDFYFVHIDGMYSVCYDKNGNLYHLSASTENVEIIKKYPEEQFEKVIQKLRGV